MITAYTLSIYNGKLETKYIAYKSMSAITYWAYSSSGTLLGHSADRNKALKLLKKAGAS